MDVSRVFPTRGDTQLEDAERETGRPLSVATRVESHKEKDLYKSALHLLYENHHFLEQLLIFKCQML
jgi:hypothetical protein